MLNFYFKIFRLFGCYEALDGGSLEEALVDFTGGVAEAISMVEHDYANDETKRLTLWASLSKEMERRSLMAAAIPVIEKRFVYKASTKLTAIFCLCRCRVDPTCAALVSVLGWIW